jgi:serine/threonine protein kinase
MEGAFNRPTPASGGAPADRVNEEELARWILHYQWATEAEVDHCLKLYRKEREQGTGRSFVDLLVSEQVLTPNQARRLVELATRNRNRIPGYQLLERIGQGSMGVVFKARQLSMDRLVAIKILSPKYSHNKEFIERFQREARLAAQLSSGNIVQAIDVGEVDGIHYFVMEYVDGYTVQHELDRGKIYSEQEALHIGIQIAQALDHAWKRGLVHRDIKPANMLISKKDGVVKLADLGLARMTSDLAAIRSEQGRSVGTAYYISPEQIRGVVDLDVRSDLYSLGATLYHMTTGRPPFVGESVREQLRAHLYEPLVPPHAVRSELSEAFSELLGYMMAKDRNQRYRQPADVAADMKSVLQRGAPFIGRETIPRPLR